MTALSRDQVRQVDRLAIHQLGIPGVVLMENAGRSATNVVCDVLHDQCHVGPESASVTVLCGGGNNGGDGYVMARHLHNQGVAVTVDSVVDPQRLAGDAAIHHAICLKMGLPVRPATTGTQLATAAADWAHAHVIVDALLGTGFTGQVRPHMASVIQRCNHLIGPVVVAVDVPSGIDCDTGMPSNATIRAQVTVTFVAQKRGFEAPQARPFVGRVVVADIGVPPELVVAVGAS